MFYNGPFILGAQQMEVSILTLKRITLKLIKIIYSLQVTSRLVLVTIKQTDHLVLKRQHFHGLFTLDFLKRLFDNMLLIGTVGYKNSITCIYLPILVKV